MAADSRGMGTTQFKVHCRALGVTKWPNRQSKSLLETLATCIHVKKTCTNSIVRHLMTAWIAELEAIKAR